MLIDGHVAKIIAQMAAITDFAVCVIDDSEAFASSELFPMTAVIRKADEYEDCFTGMSLEDKSLVVVMTRDHLHERKVLVQTLRSRASYLGMTGPRKEIDALFDHLRPTRVSTTRTSPG